MGLSIRPVGGRFSYVFLTFTFLDSLALVILRVAWVGVGAGMLRCVYVYARLLCTEWAVGN